MQDFFANIGQFGYNKLLTLVVKEDVKTWRCVLRCRKVFPHTGSPSSKYVMYATACVYSELYGKITDPKTNCVNNYLI